MGVSIDHGLGRNLRFFAKAESSPFTFAKPAATDAVKVLKSTFSPKQERKDRMDSRATRSLLERFYGGKEVSWSMEGYVIPSGAAGTKPDAEALMKCLTGVETVNGGVSAVYSASESQSALGTLSLVREMNSVYMEALVGAWVEQMSLKFNGSEEPRWTFEGGAADHFGTGYSTTNGALSGGETSVTVQAADQENFEAGSVIQVGTSINHQVTARAGAVLTITPAIVGAQSGGSAVIPYVPTETTAGSPVAGIDGSLTLDGSSLVVLSGEVVWKNNHKPITDEAFQGKATDYIPGFREITMALQVRGRRDVFLQFAKRKGTTVRDVALTFGVTAGKKLRIDMDFAEPTYEGDLEVPESEEAVFPLNFRAKGSSGADECSYTFL